MRCTRTNGSRLRGSRAKHRQPGLHPEICGSRVPRRGDEALDGYAHRLRAIGHLHEAEDESQQWPDLHAAIRAARKAYQTAGTMPDWKTLAQAAEAVRQVAL